MGALLSLCMGSISVALMSTQTGRQRRVDPRPVYAVRVEAGILSPRNIVRRSDQCAACLLTQLQMHICKRRVESPGSWLHVRIQSWLKFVVMSPVLFLLSVSKLLSIRHNRPSCRKLCRVHLQLSGAHYYPYLWRSMMLMQSELAYSSLIHAATAPIRQSSKLRMFGQWTFV